MKCGKILFIGGVWHLFAHLVLGCPHGQHHGCEHFRH